MKIPSPSRWQVRAGVVAAAICFGMLVFQLSLAMGAPLGRWAWGGEYRTLPVNLRIGSGFSAGVFLLGAILGLERTGLIRGFGKPGLARAGVWSLTVLFLFSGILNLFQAGAAEKVIMVPLALILSALFAGIAWPPPGKETA